MHCARQGAPRGPSETPGIELEQSRKSRTSIQDRRFFRARLEERLDRVDDSRIFWDDLRTKAPCDASIAPDEELLEIPTHVAGLTGVVGGLAENGVQGVLVCSSDVQLREERERDAVVDAAELLNLLGRSWLLVRELVARKADHDQAPLYVAVLERLQAHVLGREPAPRSDVDRKKHLAGVSGEALKLAAESR